MPRIADLVFIREYYIIFISILIIVVGLSFLQYTKYRFRVFGLYSYVAVILALATSVYLGTRSVNVGIDTVNYYDFFVDLSQGESVLKHGDYFFYFSMYIFSQMFLWQPFLIFCGLIYVGGAYIGIKKLFGHYALFALLLFIISPNFFQFGMNLMRNGMAASLFIMSLAWYGNNQNMMKIIMFLSICCHISMILPVGIFFLFRKGNYVKWPLILWCVSFTIYLLGFKLMSLIGGVAPAYIVGRYISRIADSDTTSIINFITYGASPIFLSWLYIYRWHYRDKLYIILLNTYMILNAIYIQFMGIEDALRFAYLSEFLMPILLFYPLLKRPRIRFQSIYMSIFLLGIFTFKATKILILNY